MTERPKRIMYVCEFCADNNPENCGYFERKYIRVMPDGRWLCEMCQDDDDKYSHLKFSAQKMAPEHKPAR